MYDASGSTLQKTITDNIRNTKTVITYIAGFVYQKVLPSTGNAASVPDTLQYVLHEEGRIRILQGTGAAVYDYFIKDHLGNVRSVITEEQRTDAYPVASLETTPLAAEKKFYFNLDSGRVIKSAGYPADNYTNPNDYVQKLSGSGAKTGMGIVLKVMAGDTISLRASSWYQQRLVTPQTPASPLNDLIAALSATIPVAGNNKITQPQLVTSVLSPGVSAFLTAQNQNNITSKPKAYVNMIVLDEQMNPVIRYDGKNSWFEQTGNDNTLTTHVVTDRQVTKTVMYIFM